MSYIRPTLTDLVARISNDIDGRMPGADSRLRHSVLAVLARVFAGALFGLYGLVDWVWRQIFPDTAEADQLNRWAAIWGVSRSAATAAVGNVTLTGANGTLVPAATQLIRADGIAYVTTGAVTIAGGSALAPVIASEPGTAGNADAATRLTLASPVVGVNAQGLVAAGGLSGGAAEQDDDGLRARLLDRIQQPPHGGNRNDYLAWALAQPGVTRAWVYPGELGLGTVTVRFVMDGRDNIIPLIADVEAVAAAIDALRPVTAAVTVLGPTPVAIDFVIRASPSTNAVQDAIRAELDDLLARDAEPGGTLLISRIREAISIAAGELDHELLSPGSNVVLPTGQLAVLGDVEFVA